MADDFAFNEGTDRTGAADDIGGVLYPRGKLIHGPDGVNDGDVSKGNGLPVGLSRCDYDPLVSVAFGSITGSYAPAASSLGSVRALIAFNTTDQAIRGSFDAGSTQHVVIPARCVRTIPVKDGATAFHVRHDGVAPLEGKLELEVVS